MIHGWCKEREPGCSDGSNEGVNGDRAVRVETVAVDDVVHALPECD